MARPSTSDLFRFEADKVGRLQCALAEAADEAQEWLNWATANDRVTKGQADATAKKIARWRALSAAVSRSDWQTVMANHGAPTQRPENA